MSNCHFHTDKKASRQTVSEPTQSPVTGGGRRTTHQLSNGVGQDFVPVVDDALCVVLDQKLHTALAFQLERRKTKVQKKNSDDKRYVHYNMK